MSRYLVIETRDPFESRDTEFVVSTAAALRERGNDVTLFLVQNGVLAARRHSQDHYLSSVAATGVRVLADAFSLRERGIADGELNPVVETAGVDVIADMLAEGTKAIWH